MDRQVIARPTDTWTEDLARPEGPAVSPLLALVAVVALLAVFFGYRKVSRYTPPGGAPVVERAQASNDLFTRLNKPVGPAKKITGTKDKKSRKGKKDAGAVPVAAEATAPTVAPAPAPPVAMPAPAFVEAVQPAVPVQVPVAAGVLPQAGLIQAGYASPAIDPEMDVHGLEGVRTSTTASPYARNIMTGDGRIALPDENDDDFSWSWKSASSPHARPIAETGAMLDEAASVSTTHDGRIALPVADLPWESDND